MKFKDLIKKKHITQKELAFRVNKTQQAVSRWVTGSCTPSPADCIKIAQILEVSEREVLECFTNFNEIV